MEFGLVLPTISGSASPEAIEAGGDAADRLGWASVWVTDHLLVGGGPTGNPDYFRIFEALTTLSYVAGRHPTLKLGTSAICVPLRNAVLLAKEIATLDALTRGRLSVAIGLGDGEDLDEYASLGMSDRYAHRGAYLDESISLWRYLWSGSTEPFHGRFHQLDNFTFDPLPSQGAALPILIGGKSAAALRRAGRLGDGYHATRVEPAQLADRWNIIQAEARAAGRPDPALSVRIRARPEGPNGSWISGTSGADLISEIRAFRDIGVTLAVLQVPNLPQPAWLDAVDKLSSTVMPLLST